MRKRLFLGLIGLLLLVLAACGSSATVVPEAKQAPAAPAAAAAKAAPAAPAAVAAPAAAAAPTALAKYAAEHAGKPGAIYVGDLNQLVGPAATKDEGDFDGNVPLDALQRHLFLYNSDFYKGLLEKAKLTNPTPLVSTGQNITIQHACINRALLFCKIVESYLAPNLLARTKGQLKLTITSFPELGVAGPDTLRLVSDGTLAMGELIGPYLGGDLPAIEIQDLFGMFPDQETNYRVIFAVAPDMEQLMLEATGGGKVIHHAWVSGNNVYFFSKKALRTLDDWKGVKFRVPSTATSDWLGGMGASAQFMAFSEVYTALERGILDGAMSGADAGWGQRWYEVTKYMNGPLLNSRASPTSSTRMYGASCRPTCKRS